MRNTKSDRDWDVPVIKRPTEKNVYKERQKVKRKTTTTKSRWGERYTARATAVMPIV
jgi:hypothetical protein